MNWVSLILAAVAFLALILLAFVAFCFYFYVKALEEAHRDGWDMPN